MGIEKTIKSLANKTSRRGFLVRSGQVLLGVVGGSATLAAFSRDADAGSMPAGTAPSPRSRAIPASYCECANLGYGVCSVSCACAPHTYVCYACSKQGCTGSPPPSCCCTPITCEEVGLSA